MHPRSLIYLVLSGYATERQKALLEEWKNLSPENAAAFEDIKRQWDEASFEHDSNYDDEKDLQDLRKKMCRWRRRRRIVRLIVIVIGTIIVAASLYWFFYQHGKHDLPSIL